MERRLINFEAADCATVLEGFVDNLNDEGIDVSAFLEGYVEGVAPLAHINDGGDALQETMVAGDVKGERVVAKFALDVVNSAVEDFMTVVEHDDMVADNLGGLHHVRRKQDDAPLLLHFPDYGEELVAAHGVET